MRFRLLAPPGIHVHQRQRAVNAGVGIDLQGRFHGPFGLGAGPGGPFVIRQREAGFNRAWRQLDGLLICRRRIGVAAADERDCTERGPCGAYDGSSLSAS